MNFNNFKATTVRGEFRNSDYADGTMLADAVFDRNITLKGDLHFGDEQTITDEEGNILSYTNSGGNIIIRINNNEYTLTPSNLIQLVNSLVTQSNFNTEVNNLTNSINNINANQIANKLISNAEFQCLENISSNIQDQLNGKTTLTDIQGENLVFDGDITFNKTVTCADTPINEDSLINKGYVEGRITEIFTEVDERIEETKTDVLNEVYELWDIVDTKTTREGIIDAGNNWTGYNFYDVILPKSELAPSLHSDFCNKQYVDTKASFSEVQSNNNTFTGSNSFTNTLTIKKQQNNAIVKFSNNNETGTRLDIAQGSNSAFNDTVQNNDMLLLYYADEGEGALNITNWNGPRGGIRITPNNISLNSDVSLGAGKTLNGITQTELGHLDGLTRNIENTFVELQESIDNISIGGTILQDITDLQTQMSNKENNNSTNINVSRLADGSVSNTEFQFLDGVSSNIQTQLDNKENNNSTGINANRIANGSVSNSRFQFLRDVSSNIQTQLDNKESNNSTGIDVSRLANGSVSNTEFQFLDGVSSNIQTQLNNRASKSTENEFTALNVFSNGVNIGGDNCNIIVDDDLNIDATNINIDATTLNSTIPTSTINTNMTLTGQTHMKAGPLNAPAIKITSTDLTRNGLLIAPNTTIAAYTDTTQAEDIVLAYFRNNDNISGTSLNPALNICCWNTGNNGIRLTKDLIKFNSHVDIGNNDINGQQINFAHLAQTDGNLQFQIHTNYQHFSAVNSNIQTQLNNKPNLDGINTFTNINLFRNETINSHVNGVNKASFIGRMIDVNDGGSFGLVPNVSVGGFSQSTQTGDSVFYYLKDNINGTGALNICNFDTGSSNGIRLTNTNIDVNSPIVLKENSTLMKNVSFDASGNVFFNGQNNFISDNFNPAIRVRQSNISTGGSINFVPNAPISGYNSTTQAGDSVIYYTKDNTLNTNHALNICAWSNTSPNGIRLTNDLITFNSNVNFTNNVINGNTINFSHLSSTSSNLQSQLSSKEDNNSTGINANRLADGSVSNTHFQHLSGVSSSIQNQLNERALLDGNNSFLGNNTFSGNLTVNGETIPNWTSAWTNVGSSGLSTTFTHSLFLTLATGNYPRVRVIACNNTAVNVNNVNNQFNEMPIQFATAGSTTFYGVSNIRWLTNTITMRFESPMSFSGTNVSSFCVKVFLYK